MDSMEEQYGYDANFIGEVLDFFKCVVCHMVLRQPVQIMTCGHLFCKPCFERIRGYSRHLNTELCCPIDRELVDVNKVFENTGIAREIGNLQVKCFSFNQGCLWQGDLRNLQGHEKDCQYKIKMQHEQKPECEKEDGLMKELLERLQKCEQSLLEKEKDLVHMKYDIHEMKSMSDRKEKEMDSLQLSNIELQNEMKVMKKSSEEMKSHFEKEVIGLKEQNQILETKVNLLEVKIVEKKEGEEIDKMLEKQMNDMKIDFTNQLSSTQNESVYSKIENSLIPLKNELSKLERDVQKTFNEIKAVRSHTDKTFNVKSNEIRDVAERLEATEKVLEMNDVKNLNMHVKNIENILFSYMPYVENEMKIKYVFTNYNYHMEKGERGSSPIFYPQLNGYSFKLVAGSCVPDKETFMIVLWLCRGRNVYKDLERFQVKFELAILNKTGTYRTGQLLSLPGHQKDSFAIPPQQQKARLPCGGIKLTKSEVQDYVINDSMYITCTFRLS